MSRYVISLVIYEIIQTINLLEFLLSTQISSMLEKRHRPLYLRVLSNASGSSIFQIYLRRELAVEP